MDIYSGHINRLIEELSRLPGVGAKSAQRLAFHIINMPESEVKSLADTMIDAKQHIHYCKECFTLTDEELCPICRDQKRDHKTIMVESLSAYNSLSRQEVMESIENVIEERTGVRVSIKVTKLNDDEDFHSRFVDLKELVGIDIEVDDKEELI